MSSRLIGFGMIAAFFAIVFGAVAAISGFKLALAVFVVSGALTAWVVVGVNLTMRRDV